LSTTAPLRRVIPDSIYPICPISVHAGKTHFQHVYSGTWKKEAEDMHKIILTAMKIGLLSFGLFTSCHTMGEITGEAAEEVEEGAEEFEEGYEEEKDE
jgi:beta-galactosidase GanA